jgi:vacuolar protein sorting-associated protein 13A/C
MRVETHIEGSSIFLYVTREGDPWPLKLRNDTGINFTFQQAVSEGLGLSSPMC